MNKPKRTINAGLAAWNLAKAYISKENRKQGKKFNRVEVDQLVKVFLLEQFGKSSFDYNDLDLFLKNEVPEFYDNLLDVSEKSLAPVPFYLLDHKLQSEMPMTAEIVVNAGPFGVVTFLRKDYDYHSSGVSEIVEQIRDEMFPTGKTVSLDDMNGFFDGHIRRKSGAASDSTAIGDYFIEWILFFYDEYVSDLPKDFVEPASWSPQKKNFKPSDLFKNRHKGKGKTKLAELAKRKKDAKTPGVKITEPKVSKVSKAKTPKVESAEFKKLASENKKLKSQLNKQASEISDLKKMMAEVLKSQAELISALKPKTTRKRK